MHTKGPWKMFPYPYESTNPAFGDSTITINAGGTFIADVAFNNDEEKANARLIQHAPDLLEACKYGREVHHEDGVIIEDGPDLLYKVAYLLREETQWTAIAAKLAYKADLERKAIAKAEGEDGP